MKTVEMVETILLSHLRVLENMNLQSMGAREIDTLKQYHHREIEYKMNKLTIEMALLNGFQIKLLLDALALIGREARTKIQNATAAFVLLFGSSSSSFFLNNIISIHS